MKIVSKTRRGGYTAYVQDGRWDRADFTYLGVIDFGHDYVIGWAWHADGRSIDRDDNAFDLVDFAYELIRQEVPYAFWLGGEGGQP